MTDPVSILAKMHRPKVLIRAARAGVSDYRRERDLKRFIRNPKSSSPIAAFEMLLAEESRLEGVRNSGDANYSIQRHVALLTALIAEARLLPSFRPARELAIAA
ncbi:MAG: DUF6477 family protein [Pseudomonadota bacterium]